DGEFAEAGAAREQAALFQPFQPEPRPRPVEMAAAVPGCPATRGTVDRGQRVAGKKHGRDLRWKVCRSGIPRTVLTVPRRAGRAPGSDRSVPGTPRQVQGETLPAGGF